MDYDKETKILFTGDEMGYMNKWDLSKLIQKMEDLKPSVDINAADQILKQKTQKATFLTGFNAESNQNPKMIFTSEDVVQVHRWEAHKDLINMVTYVPELNIIATCSFDCNVYMFRASDCTKCGSLLLGTGTTPDGEQTPAE